jgi:hypothetical protein
MLVRCEPLYPTDPTPTCGEWFDDLDHSWVCPHKWFPDPKSPEVREVIDAYLEATSDKA